MDFDSELWLSNTSVAPGKVTNFVIDLNSKTCKHEIVDNASVEFPTTHPYRQGLSGTRYNYLMANDRPGENIPYRDVVKVGNILLLSRSVFLSWYQQVMNTASYRLLCCYNSVIIDYDIFVVPKYFRLL